MAEIIDGKAIAKKLRDEVAVRAKAFESEHGRPAGLTVLLVGEDPASVVYTRNKEKAAIEVGVRGVLERLPADTSEEQLLSRIAELNEDPSVDGILVQLPLPKHIRELAVLDAILPAKDVDGFHPMNAGLLAVGRPVLVPCTPSGVMRMLSEHNVTMEGARAVIVGRSNIVGKPMAQLLLAENATVTLAHSKTRDLVELCQTADILVAAVGRARMLGRAHVKPGAVVVDVGINRDADGKLCGDVDFAGASEVAGAITPVPGGVGPMTIACLLDNTIRAAVARRAAG